MRAEVRAARRTTDKRAYCCSSDESSMTASHTHIDELAAIRTREPISQEHRCSSLTDFRLFQLLNSVNNLDLKFVGN